MGSDERGEVNDGGGEGWMGCVGEDREASVSLEEEEELALLKNPTATRPRTGLVGKDGVSRQKEQAGAFLGGTNYCSARIKAWAYSGRAAESASTTSAQGSLQPVQQTYALGQGLGQMIPNHSPSLSVRTVSVPPKSCSITASTVYGC